ncbi:MAG: hypothetical protein SGPRY_002974 [Prymnesium sp.]
MLSSSLLAAVMLPLAAYVWYRHDLLLAPSPRLYTTQQLQAEMRLTGALLLIVLGKVYDVSSGAQYYSEGEHYHGYCIGLDHTRAFLSADFEKDASDDLSNVTAAHCLSLKHWIDFYVEKDQKEEYPYRGIHQGRVGNPTEALQSFQSCVRAGEERKARYAESTSVAPNCTRTPLQKTTGADDSP